MIKGRGSKLGRVTLQIAITVRQRFLEVVEFFAQTHREREREREPGFPGPGDGIGEGSAVGKNEFPPKERGNDRPRVRRRFVACLPLLPPNSTLVKWPLSHEGRRGGSAEI